MKTAGEQIIFFLSPVKTLANDIYRLLLKIVHIQAPADTRQSAAIRHSQYRKWLQEHREEYAGQWVALDGDRLVSFGKNNREVLAEARRQGVRVPFVAYVEPTDALPFGGW
jgi:hypothetical protein